MKFNVFFILLVLLPVVSVFSQKEANFWYFGSYAALDFNSGGPVAVTGSMVNTLEGSASISDASGNLLFYTDGTSVWNKNNVQMPNGSGLLGNYSSTQSAIIVQKPGSTTTYYIFTSSIYFGPLCYSEVDMNLNGGLGDVTTKNVVLVNSSCEKITGVRHCNNKDLWVVSHDYGSNRFSTFLVTSAGVNTTPVTSNSGLVVTGGSYDVVIGHLKASPEGSHLGSAIYDNAVNRFELFDFDNSTGIVSNAILFPKYFSFVGAYGLEFSPDGTKFYAAIMTPGEIRQFDLCAGSAAAIISSEVLIGTMSSGYIGALQLGPDNKIYVAEYGKNYLGAINSPNTLGMGCNFVDNAVSLGTGSSGHGLPNFAPYYFEPVIPPFTTTINCLTVDFVSPTINLSNCSGSTTAINSYVWDFGDPASGASNAASIANPTHAFSAGGTYNVKLIVSYGCGSDTIQQNIDLVSCAFNAFAVPAAVCDGSCTNISVIASGGSSPYNYLWSQGGVTAAINVCPTSPTTYSVTITDASSNTVTTTVTVSVNSLTYAVTPSDAGCNNPLGSAQVNVGVGTSPYTYSWSDGQTGATATSLTGGTTYSVSVSDAAGCSQLQTVSIGQVAPIVLTTTPQTICAGDAVMLSANVTSGGVSPFTYLWNPGNLTGNGVTTLPTLTTTYTVIVTDANTCSQTQTLTVNVNTITATAGTSQTIYKGATIQLTATGGGTYAWAPSQSLDDASSASPIASPTVTTTYTVLVTATNGCTAIRTLTIEVLDCVNGDVFIPNAFSPNGDVNNDLFYVRGGCIIEFRLMIYDRWGNKVFETNDFKLGWDGTVSGKQVDSGVYAYALYYKLQNGKTAEKSGNVTLVR